MRPIVLKLCTVFLCWFFLASKDIKLLEGGLAWYWVVGARVSLWVGRVSLEGILVLEDKSDWRWFETLVTLQKIVFLWSVTCWSLMAGWGGVQGWAWGGLTLVCLTLGLGLGSSDRVYQYCQTVSDGMKNNFCQYIKQITLPFSRLLVLVLRCWY